MIIAADHPARGALRAGDRPARHGRPGRPAATGSAPALSRPGVNGVLGTPDILEDLLLLGALDDKVVIGSMNRGGLAGTAFEIDDRFTAYDAASIAAAGFEGGKMLLRIDPDDPAPSPPWRPARRAVSDLAGTGLMAMVEPFISHRVDGRVRNELTAEAMIRAMTVAAGLGTHLGVHLAEGPGRRGHGAGDGGHHAARADPRRRGRRATRTPRSRSWSKALALPTVQGLVIGRSPALPTGRRRRGRGRPGGEPAVTATSAASVRAGARAG